MPLQEGRKSGTNVTSSPTCQELSGFFGKTGEAVGTISENCNWLSRAFIRSQPKKRIVCIGTIRNWGVVPLMKMRRKAKRIQIRCHHNCNEFIGSYCSSRVLWIRYKEGAHNLIGGAFREFLLSENPKDLANVLKQRGIQRPLGVLHRTKRKFSWETTG